MFGNVGIIYNAQNENVTFLRVDGGLWGCDVRITTAPNLKSKNCCVTA